MKVTVMMEYHSLMVLILPQDGESQFGEFPWMGIILEDELIDYDQVIKRYVCGASLIHPQVVMTGAHCING